MQCLPRFQIAAVRLGCTVAICGTNGFFLPAGRYHARSFVLRMLLKETSMLYAILCYNSEALVGA